MKPKDSIINSTFAYKGIGGMVYVVTVLGFEKKGEKYDSDSYTGMQTMIFPIGNTLTQEWSCCADIFEDKVISGRYIRIK